MGSCRVLLYLNTVTPSASSSALSVLRPVECGRAGRTACAARMPRGTRRASSPPSPSFTPFRCAALRSRRRPPIQPRPSAAPGRVPGSPQPPPNHGSRFAWCRAAGRRSRSRWSPCGSGRFAPCGPVRMAGRSRETARLGFACSAARSPAITSRCNACTDAAAALHRLKAVPLRVADRSGDGAPVPAPETPRPVGRCASRCSLRPRLAPSAALRNANRPAADAARGSRRTDGGTPKPGGDGVVVEWWSSGGGATKC